MSLSVAKDFLAPARILCPFLAKAERKREAERQEGDRVRREGRRQEEEEEQQWASSDLRGVVTKQRKRDGRGIHQVCVST